MPIPNAHTVFAYGTLRRGERNHALLAGAHCIGEGETADRFILMDLGPYPAVLIGESPAQPTPIRGEVYQVDDATFRRLDRLEDYPGFYDRRQFPINLDGGGEITAWMYFLTPDTCPPGTAVASGDWTKQ